MPPQNPSQPGPPGPPSQSGPRPKGQGPPPPPKRAPVGLLIGILLVVLIFWMVADRGPGREISYTTFQRVLEAGHVVGELRVGEQAIEGKVRSGVLPEKGATGLGNPDGGPDVEFYAVRAPEDGTEKLIDDYNARVPDERKNPRRNVVNRSIGPTLLLWLPMLLIMGVMVVFLMRRMGGVGEQVMAFGKSKARISLERNTGTTFEDVAGCEEAKEELTEIVAYLKHPDRFRRLGGKIPKGVLLMGPPGTGKTLMARAVAGEAAVPFISVSGPEFMEMFVGVGAARVRDLFAKAKQKAPCIVFMDEIDAVGRHRGAGMGGGQEEREQTLNQLLVEMDGFEGTIGVIVLAATNRPDILDPALLRPGRFDRQVVLDHPDARGRAQILAVHARGKAIAPDVNLEIVAQRTPGFTGADLANVMNEAALLAARRDREHITMADVEEAIDRVLSGPERRSRVIRPKEKRIIAYHECGHALTAAFIPDVDPVHKVSIVPRGQAALGYTLMLPEQDRYVLRREELLGRICVSLGGRIAEELAFGQQSTGAADDLDRVTDIARSMICRYGMSERLGPLVFERQNGRAYLNGPHETTAKGNFSEATLGVIDAEAKEIVEACQARTRDILTKNRPLLDRMAARLLEVEVMDAADFRAAIDKLCGELGLAPPPKRGDEA